MFHSSKYILSGLALVFATSAPSGAWAEGNMKKNGSASMSDTSQTGETSQTGQGQGDKMKMAKSEVAPHSVMIQTALNSAREQLNGLETQLQVGGEQQQPSPEAVEHFNIHKASLKRDLDLAATHKQHLTNSVKKHPEVAKSEDYKQLDEAFNRVQQLQASWMKSAESKSYWNQKDKAMSDIRELRSRIDKAAQEAEDFNSKEFQIATLKGSETGEMMEEEQPSI